MNYWLEADPQDILDEVIHSRQLAGEYLDETAPSVRKMVLQDIRASQTEIARSVVERDGMVSVFRSMRVDPSEFEGFEARGLGVCWAFDRAGAFAYDGRRAGTEVILEARVAADEVAWPFVIAMWSSGEGEARLDRRATIIIESIRTSAGEPIRPDIWGAEYGVDGQPAAKVSP